MLDAAGSQASTGSCRTPAAALCAQVAQSRQADEPVAMSPADCGGHDGSDGRYGLRRLFESSANLQRDGDRYIGRGDPLDATRPDSPIRLGRQPSEVRTPEGCSHSHRARKRRFCLPDLHDVDLVEADFNLAVSLFQLS